MGKAPRIRARVARRLDGLRGPRPAIERLEPRRLLATFTVTVGGDDTMNPPPGSLREAILLSDAMPGTSGPNQIIFALKSPNNVIQPAGPLPRITAPVTIDGRDPATGGPGVVLDGSMSTDQGTDAIGLDVEGSGCVIEGLAVVKFGGSGLLLAGNSNTVTDSYIGVGADGMSLGGNGVDGVDVTGARNTIGSPNVMDDMGNLVTLKSNIITNNGVDDQAGDGIKIEGARATSNLVVGNDLGFDLSGNSRLGQGNFNDGVQVDGASNNTIGGPSPADRNVISGNGIGGDNNPNNENGVEVDQAQARGNLIEGNYIGVDVTGTGVQDNSGDGVQVFGSPGNTIEGNVVANNNSYGVEIDGATASGNRLVGNLIGLDSTGETEASNMLDGIRLIGAPGNTIGGTNAADRNVISGNGQNGIFLQVDFSTNSAASGNLILGNYIGTDVQGTGQFGNTLNGIEVINVAGNTIGGAVAGNVIANNGNDGVLITGPAATGNLLLGNLIGVDAGGESRFGNTVDGVRIIDAADNTVGGTAPGEQEVISGNNADGIEIDTSGTSGTVPTRELILGNFIGLDARGSSSIPNLLSGIFIDGGSSNTIGGTTTSARNVVSTNNLNGIEIQDNGVGKLGVPSDDNLVEGNYIGSDKGGSRALGNLGVGLRVVNGSGNTIGGDVPGARNVVMSNGSLGIAIYGSTIHDPKNPTVVIGNTSERDLIQGNIVGADASGSIVYPNGNDGILINNSVDDIIGGTTPPARNVIYDNSGNGINLAYGADSDAVLGNYIGIGAQGETGVGNHGSGVLVYSSSGDTIGGTAPGAGNVISNNQISGVDLSLNATDNLVEGNLIGLDPSGRVAAGNGLNGVSIEGGAKGNTVGGLAGAASRDVISGNTDSGVSISQGSYGAVSGNVVAGDYIGTDLTGNSALGANGRSLGNLADGVVIDGSAGNTIGGDVISGNRLDGMLIAGAGATGNVVFADSIGVGRDGAPPPGALSTALGNGQDGIFIVGAPGNVIGLPDVLNPDGSTARLLGDVISGNFGIGVQILGVGSAGNVLQGNLIGTDFGGTLAEGNLGGGVFIADSPGDVIGGLGLGARNVISANLASGVQVQASSPTAPTAVGDIIAGNFIGLGSTGQRLANSGDGVLIRGAAAANVAGNVISANLGSGVDIVLSAGDQVVANRIGTDPSGTVAEGNASNGVVFNNASFDALGGFAPASGNVISGNSGNGVAILAGSSSIGVVGNRIGTDPTGSVGVGNTADGVLVQGASPFDAILSDVVSANAAAGIEVAGSITPTAIQGDVVGLNLIGTYALGNSYGVYLNDSVGTTVGGTNPGAGNLISGNTIGVVVTSTGTFPFGDAIQGNLIGTDGSGRAVPAGPSQQYGIFLNGAPFNLIGGTTPGARNVISGNATTGLLIANQVGSDALQAKDPNLDLGDVVQGNFIGTTLAATPLLVKGRPAQGIGVAIDSSAGNVVGGLTPPSANVIAGDTVGVEIVGVVAQRDPGGAKHGNTVALDTIAANTFGLFINGGQYNTIVGDGLDFNSQVGLSIVGSSAKGNRVEGNTIAGNGTAASGALPSSSIGDGVFIEAAIGNTIQGNTIESSGLVMADGQRNGVGVYVFDGASGNVVARNSIRGSSAYGILVFNSAANLGTIYRSGSNRNAIGGSGIADFREYTGPVTATVSTSGSTPKGPKARKK